MVLDRDINATPLLLPDISVAPDTRQFEGEVVEPPKEEIQKDDEVQFPQQDSGK